MRGARGIFERPMGSGIWWVQHFDAEGRRRREKVGRKSDATALYHKRKVAARQGLKLPENLRKPATTFSELAEDTLTYSRAHKRSWKDDVCRMARVVDEFGQRGAEQITHAEIDAWLESHDEWARATKNRFLALIKLTYRIGEENGKLKINPARLLHMQQENNARVRYLNQHKPMPTKLRYLRDCHDEESRLVAVIRKKYPFHLAEWEIALHSGMRRSEQYATEWPNVTFERKLLTVPRSKHGETRHVRLNAIALAAFQSLLPNMATSNFAFLNQDGHDALRGNKHWFEDAVAEAGVRDFTWHDLRHTFASRLVMQGVDLRTVQVLMGHKTIGMTCRYAHLAPEHEQEAVEKLVGFGRGAVPQPGRKHRKQSATTSATAPKRRPTKVAA